MLGSSEPARRGLRLLADVRQGCVVTLHGLDAVGAVFAQALMEGPGGVEVAEDARTDRSSRQLLRAAEDPLACGSRHVTARVKQFRLNPHPKTSELCLLSAYRRFERTHDISWSACG